MKCNSVINMKYNTFFFVFDVSSNSYRFFHQHKRMNNKKTEQINKISYSCLMICYNSPSLKTTLS